ncbi:hypothetical protein M422DRAFT_255997 [Sphaerobolus stellatus SS14]|uniref:Unplaced genomic scaffold SPHSTscaffold_64, whole genome shotgun sequence n=1 Tax=Sphaerobolus stellatus (strain SS14) TaxID=990650 RepID=A0A0C9VRY7_SPHS4|nr:hypothetical protein M422DRAFT_255997 [Sphaerobolus stellatus SS14]
MTSFPSLPIELYLELFSHFSLKALVASRGTCREWRNLVPKANIPPPRRLLLDLYLELIEDEYFHLTRPWVLENLKEIDREAYVGALIQQGANLPEDFRLWVLEWPAKATIAGIWPGLPDDAVEDGFKGRLLGRNVLGIIPLQLSSIPFVPTQRCIPAICLWVGCPPNAVWLPLDEESGIYGKVLICDIRGALHGVQTGDYGIDVDLPNFVMWLRCKWSGLANRLRMINEGCLGQGNTSGKPLENKSYDMFGTFDIPAPPWHLKDTPPYDTLLQQALDDGLDAEGPEWN